MALDFQFILIYLQMIFLWMKQVLG